MEKQSPNVSASAPFSSLRFSPPKSSACRPINPIPQSLLVVVVALQKPLVCSTVSVSKQQGTKAKKRSCGFDASLHKGVPVVFRVAVVGGVFVQVAPRGVEWIEPILGGCVADGCEVRSQIGVVKSKFVRRSRVVLSGIGLDYRWLFEIPSLLQLIRFR